jgi:hypothetical protein
MAEKKVAKKAEAKPKEKVEKAAKPAQPKKYFAARIDFFANGK